MKDWCLIELLVVHWNTLNHLTVCKRTSNVDLSYQCYIAIIETL